MSKTRTASFSLLTVLLLLLSSCGGGGKKEAKEVPAETAMVEVSITGMTCAGCENTIQSSLAKVPGVVSVTASTAMGNAIVEYDPALVDTLKIKETVDGCGYTAVKVMPHQEKTEN